MKKRWVLIGVLVGALALTITGGIALAQSASTTTAQTPFQTFVGKVAAKLGIDQSKVQDAMTQASKEMQNDALQQRLNNLVAQGKLSQAQADQLSQWYQSRPDIASGAPGFPGIGGFGHGPLPFGGRMPRGGRMFGGMEPMHGMSQAPSPSATATPQGSGA